MSKAIQCDRCGICFDPEKLSDVQRYCHFKEPVLVNGKDAARHQITDYFRDRHARPLFDVDLCKDCTNKFIDFMEECKRSDVEPRY